MLGLRIIATYKMVAKANNPPPPPSAIDVKYEVYTDSCTYAVMVDA